MWVGSPLDAVDKRRDFREERVVVSVDVALLVVVSGATDVEGGRVVRVDEAHVESVRPDFKLARIGMALQGDGVSEGADGAVFVFPIDVSFNALIPFLLQA